MSRWPEAANRGRWRRAWELARDPVTAEKRHLLAERWAELDPALRGPLQGLGQKATGCGATIGVEPRCDFSCTGCYLGAEANDVPALPTRAVLAQIDRLRRHLGPKSNVQITDGEVTLRPTEELIAILRHARAVGAVPMVMTHGDSFRRRPGLLEQLMTEGGLTEISVHIDITQRGRLGHRAPTSELELMPLREEFAIRIRAARAATGRTLRAAMTLTVTPQNLPQVADVVRFAIAHRDAFSLVSFQPLAPVGRTRRGLSGVTPDELWREIDRATAEHGAPPSGPGFHFGHPACTRFAPYLAIEPSGQTARLLPLVRDADEDRTIVAEYFALGLGGAAFRDDSPFEAAGRAAGMLRAAPGFFLGRARRWASARLRTEAGLGPARLAADLLRGRVRVSGLTFTSHHFMGPEELRTPLGRDRLAACVFQVPIGDRLVPMCEANAAGVREEFYARIGGARNERRHDGQHEGSLAPTAWAGVSARTEASPAP